MTLMADPGERGFEMTIGSVTRLKTNGAVAGEQQDRANSTGANLHWFANYSCPTDSTGMSQCPGGAPRT